ncbi:MAG: VTT domain-containing protein [Patescibacteria group bacterium]
MSVHFKELMGIIIIGAMFIGGSFIAGAYENTIRAWLDIGSGGIIVYILLAAFATVIAPVSTLPLLPIAVALWGALATAISSIIGWFAGALIAFWLARTLGRPLVTRIVNLEKIARYERALEGKYVFWNLIFLRLVIPVDVLSYAVGFFTSIDFKIYALATLIGITPFAFVFSYASEAALPIRLGALLAVVVASFLGYLKVQRGRKT